MNTSELSSAENIFHHIIHPDRLDRLLRHEKERRGVPPDRLVFLSMSNIAAFRWCAQKAVLVS